MPNPFFWYELMTDDLDAAEAFYTHVVGWRAEAYPTRQDMPRYVVMNSRERGVGGLMTIPDPVKQAGGHPAWIGYVHTPDIKAAVEKLRKGGGTVHREPAEIPGVGTFAVVSDPQGAMFQFLQPNGPDQPALPQNTPGHVGWHELFTSDWKAALDFYGSQFGWTKQREFDMGEMGIYALFSMTGQGEQGGMMNKPPQIPRPVWLFYFNVADGIDAASKRVTDKGGKVLMGPTEVPGGMWIAQCQDPQGAHFALLSGER